MTEAAGVKDPRDIKPERVWLHNMGKWVHFGNVCDSEELKTIPQLSINTTVQYSDSLWWYHVGMLCTCHYSVQWIFCQLCNYQAPNEQRTPIRPCPTTAHKLWRFAKAALMWFHVRRQIRVRAFPPAGPGDFIVPSLKPSGCQLQAHGV